MNIISFTKTFGLWEIHFDIIGALALGFGVNFFRSTIGAGISLGPFVLSVTYTQPYSADAQPSACSIQGHAEHAR